MTFTEYINQEDPQKLGTGTVTIEPEDADSFYRSGDNIIVSINIKGKQYEYIATPGNHVLRTMDGDGNPKKVTVFKISSMEIPGDTGVVDTDEPVGESTENDLGNANDFDGIIKYIYDELHNKGNDGVYALPSDLKKNDRELFDELHSGFSKLIRDSYMEYQF